jgi:hypothetical protein
VLEGEEDRRQYLRTGDLGFLYQVWRRRLLESQVLRCMQPLLCGCHAEISLMKGEKGSSVLVGMMRPCSLSRDPECLH